MTTDTLSAVHITGMALPSDPHVSPDGRRVAFTVQAAARTTKQKTFAAAVWVAQVHGATPARRWTGGDAHNHMPRWSPDGRSLAFLSDRAEAGKHQLYVLPAEGGEGQQVTHWNGGISTFAWSPDSRRLAFTAADERWATETKEREASGDDAEVWGQRLGYHRLRLIGRDGGEVTTLGPDDRHVTEFAWSPSGHELALALAVRPDLDAPAEGGIDVVRLAVDGNLPRPICHVPFGVADVTWTRDGAALVFKSWEVGEIPSSAAAFVASAAGGTPRCLTAGMDGCVLALRRGGQSDAVLCSVAEGLTTRVYALDPESGRRTLRHQSARGTATGELGTDAAGRMLALVCSAGNEPPEVWAGEGVALRRVSDCNPGLAGKRWAGQEPFTWTAPDGLALDGLLLRPHDARGTPPGVVLAHGGPYGRWADGFNCSWSNWAQWLALDGYAVFLPNTRGGMGHGHAFAATVAGEVGMADWLDVASGADAFVAGGHADGERLGIGGWSQGGFMTAWAISGGIREGMETRGWNEDYTAWRTRPGDRFRAGVMGAGVSDWGAMVSESDMPTFEAMLGGSRPGDGIGPLRHHAVSPLSYVSRARTPLLILHGRNDERVPAGQATGFFRELRRRAVPTELVRYPRQPHAIQEEAHQADLLRRVREWYGRWLGTRG